MELEHVGTHCSVTTCKQKDFLPFVCDFCKKSLCVEHRLYSAHGCRGGLAKDITSIDCPVCGSAVKFDRSQDVNSAWEIHYAVECTQVAAKKKIVKTCAKNGCRTVLGLSNSYNW